MKELDGAWEEGYVFGKRIEIEGKRITILWRSGPVLETTFRTRNADGGTELVLKKNGLRYAGAASDYASVSRLTYRDGNLTLCEWFPITGASETVMNRTDRSRYGNYDVANEVLQELQGRWKDEQGGMTLDIRNNRLTIDGEKTTVCVLRSRSDGRIVVANEDPAVLGFGPFSRFDYADGFLITHMVVCDGPTITFRFHKYAH